MWNASEELFSLLPTDGFVWIQGQTQPYQGEMQIIIQQIEKVTPSELELADLMPCTKYDVEEMFAELSAMLATLGYLLISGSAFAFNALGNGISWPTINPGIDVSAGIAIEETVLYRVVPPEGYTTDDLETVKVKVRVNIFGPQLR